VIEASESESQTVVTKLPVEGAEAEQPAAEAPRRRLRFPRRRSAEAAAADPWEV
jgi:hypothetical protein